jgi:hypothetical protein
MVSLGRLAALFLIFVVTSIAWLVLGGVTVTRALDAPSRLRGEVDALWGRPLALEAPTVRATWETVERRRPEPGSAEAGRGVPDVEVRVPHEAAPPFDSTRGTLRVHEDVRRKGLVWYPLFEASVDLAWTVTSPAPQAGSLTIAWPFPDPTGDYDDLELVVDGLARPDALDAAGDRLRVTVPTAPGQVHAISLRVRARGRDALSLRGAPGGVGDLRDFDVTVSTDFGDVDFPAEALSPSSHEATDDGRALRWRFDHMVTGKVIGVVVPCPVQPGELAASMAFSAPISLGLFMVWIVVLGVLRGVDVHPMNHAMLAASFFAFHLLFAYSADWMPVEAAFALSAAVSVALVVTYLARVVSPRFAFIEAGAAQGVYLVGFALAHFWEGLTGLTLTVLGVATLGALMQLTAHVRWSDVLGARGAAAPSTGG